MPRIRRPGFTREEIETVKSRIRITCHRRQRNFVFDLAKWVSLLCGRGSGKTFAAMMRLVIRMMTGDENTGRGANCLYIAKTREHARKIIWTDLKDVLSACGFELTKEEIKSKWQVKFDETRTECRFINGSTLSVLGFDNRDDIEKPRGQTWHEVAIDEAGSAAPDLLYRLAFEVLGPRCYCLVLLGTPDRNLLSIFCDATRPSSDEHIPYDERDKFPADETKWSSHRWNIMDALASDNQAVLKAIEPIYRQQLALKKRNKWTDTSPEWLREYEAQWVADGTTNVYNTFRPYLDDGAEFNIWTPKRDSFGIAERPPWPKSSWGYGIGFDYGDKVDAFAIVVLAFSYDDKSRTLFHLWEYNGPKPSPKAVASMLLGSSLNRSKPGGLFGLLGREPDIMVGDFAGKGGHFFGILEGEFGLKVLPADKTKGKDHAIETVNDDFYQGRIRVLKDSELAKELAALQWQFDMDGKRVENSKQANNATDAMLYCRVAVGPSLPAWDGADAENEPLPTPALKAVQYLKPKHDDDGDLDLSDESGWETLSDEGGWDQL